MVVYISTLWLHLSFTTLGYNYYKIIIIIYVLLPQRNGICRWYHQKLLLISKFMSAAIVENNIISMNLTHYTYHLLAYAK